MQQLGSRRRSSRREQSKEGGPLVVLPPFVARHGAPAPEVQGLTPPSSGPALKQPASRAKKDAVVRPVRVDLTANNPPVVTGRRRSRGHNIMVRVCPSEGISGARSRLRFSCNLSSFLGLAVAFALRAVTPVGGQGASFLADLYKYEQIRASTDKASVRRVNNTDVITTSNGENLGFFHFVFIMPFSIFPMGPQQRITYTAAGTLEGSMAFLLAAQHLNAGDGSIVREVEGLNERCNLRFTTELFDSEESQRRAVDQTIEVLSRIPGEQQLPSTFLGNERSAVSMATSVITSVRRIPQLSPISTSSQLDDKSQYSHFGRVVPSDDGTAIAAILYYSKVAKASHVGVVHTSDGYGISYARSLQKARRDYAPEMKLRFIDNPYDTQLEDIKTAVSFLKSTEYRYFFAIIEPRNFNSFMEEAYSEGIAGTGKHNWMFSDSLPPETIVDQTYERGSPLHLATRGVSMLPSRGGMPGMAAYESFLEQWHALKNAPDIDFILSKQPKYPEQEAEYTPQPMNDAFFQTPNMFLAPYLYDSAIAAGLAACNVPRKGSYLDGDTLFNQILRSDFQGTTGNVTFDQSTGSRDFNSALFRIVNFVDDKVNDNSQTVKFSQSEPLLFENGKWKSLLPFIYNDGTSTIQPELPPREVNMNYIGTGLRAGGLALAGVVICLSAGFAAWTMKNRGKRIVKSSQPIFLHVICFGVLLMGSAIIPFSLDDEIVSEDTCSGSCMAFPWLFCLGFATSFSALFSKTLRINKIFRGDMRRIVITPGDVIKPLVVFLAANILVLSLWTALSPLVWTRENIAYDKFDRAVASRGYCTSDSYLIYAVILVVINLGMLASAMAQAYIARHIATEFAESEHIAQAVALCFLVCLVGVPAMVIASEDSKAQYFLMTCIIFVLCISLLLFIFVPKIVFHKKKDKPSIRMSIEQSKNKPSDFNSSAFLVSSPSSELGMVIIDHAKMREETKTENMKIRAENKQLVKDNSQLKSLLQEQTKSRRTSVRFSMDEEKSEEKGLEQASETTTSFCANDHQSSHLSV